MITLGRAANNDIRLNLPSISKFHAYFTHVQSNNTWYVADANSSNGTFVNGERLKSDRNRLKLENGAAIRLGTDVTMRFFESKSFYEFLLTRLGGGSKNA
jgi:pSer/pThr/pTyr-binding forkhead associated (FHA) protein